MNLCWCVFVCLTCLHAIIPVLNKVLEIDIQNNFPSCMTKSKYKAFCKYYQKTNFQQIQNNFHALFY